MGSESGEHEQVFLSACGFLRSNDVSQVRDGHLVALVVHEREGLAEIVVPGCAVRSQGDVEGTSICLERDGHHVPKPRSRDATWNLDTFGQAIQYPESCVQISERTSKSL